MTGVQLRTGRRRAVAGGAGAVAGVLLIAANMRTGVVSVPPILGDLGLSRAGQSLLAAIPVVCFCVGALAGPTLRVRAGEERALMAALVAIAAGFALRAAAPQHGLFAGTIVAGLGIAVVNVLLPSLIHRRFRARAGAMTAAYTTVLGVSAALATGLVVPVLRATGSTSAALAIVLPPVLLALLAWAPQLRGAGPPAGARRRTLGGASIWREPLAWRVTLFMGFLSVAHYGTLSWLPAIYRDHGVDAATAGVYLMATGLVATASSAVAPLAAARGRDQRAAIAAACALLGAGTLGLLLAPLGAPLLWALLIGLGQGAGFSLALLVMVLRAEDGGSAAALSSMAQFGGYAIAIAGPLAMGLLHDATGGWAVPLLFLLAVIAATLAAGLGAGRDAVVRA